MKYNIQWKCHNISKGYLMDRPRIRDYMTGLNLFSFDVLRSDYFCKDAKFAIHLNRSELDTIMNLLREAKCFECEFTVSLVASSVPIEIELEYI